METKVEALEGSVKKLTVTIDAAEIDERIKATYRDFAFKYNFPGFRKGKAPRPVIDNLLGKQAVVATVTDDVINKLYPLAMDENNLVAIGQPKFEQESELVEAGKAYTYTVEVECTPEFELSSYEPVVVELPSVEATDSEIQSQIDELANYYFEFKDCSANTKVKDGNFVDIAMKATNAEGEPIEALTTESRLYEIGGGLLPKSFDEALKGLKKGQETEVEIDMAKEPSMMGSGASLGVVKFEVKINLIREKVTPELTDEWARETAGFEGMDDLRTRIAENIKVQKEQMMPRLRETEALYKLQERLQGEAPAALCENEEQNLLQNFFMQVQQSGMTFDSYLAQMNLTPEQFKEDIKKQAQDVCSQDLALDAWARHANIEITDEEISAEFDKAGAEDPRALEAEWRAAGRMSMLRQGMRRTAALNQILDELVVEDLKSEGAEDEKAEKKPAKKSSTKKASTKKKAEEAEGAEVAEEKPAKKTTRKSSTKKAAENTEAAADAE